MTGACVGEECSVPFRVPPPGLNLGRVLPQVRQIASMWANLRLP